MSTMFEKLKKLAAEEFGCSIVHAQQKTTFHELFGFSIPVTVTLVTTKKIEMEAFFAYTTEQISPSLKDFDINQMEQISLAA